MLNSPERPEAFVRANDFLTNYGQLPIGIRPRKRSRHGHPRCRVIYQVQSARESHGATAELERNPQSISLRERLREISVTSKHKEEAARQCLGLASIYIERENFNTAHERLLEAKQLDPRINIARGLEAIRRARRPDLTPPLTPTESAFGRTHATLAGDLGRSASSMPSGP